MRQLSREDVIYVPLNDAPAGIDIEEQVDNARCLPGDTGIIPNAELIRILQKTGYDGPVTVEPFNRALREVAERNPLEAARMTRASLHRVVVEAGL